MEKNVQKIDLNELKKAREALNEELGISSPASKTTHKKFDDSNNSNYENYDENYNSAQNDSIESFGDDGSEKPNQNFSVYDNFAPFEVNKGVKKSKSDTKSDEKIKVDSLEELFDNANSVEVLQNYDLDSIKIPEENSEKEESSDEEDSDKEAMNLLNELSKMFEDDLQTDETASDNQQNDESEQTKKTEELAQQNKNDDSFVENNAETKTPSKAPNIDVDGKNYNRNQNNSDNIPQKPQKFDDEQDLQSYSEPSRQMSQANNYQQSAEKYGSKEQNAQTEMREPATYSESPRQMSQAKNQDILSNKENSAENISDKKTENKNIDEKNTEQPRILTDSTNFYSGADNNASRLSSKAVLGEDVDNKTQNNLDETNINSKPVENDNESKEELYPKIDDFNFIDIIKSKSFMDSDKLTCIYGIDENKNVICQNFKDFYNTAIFCENNDVVFKLFSSIIVSLTLKNVNFDMKFVICDSDNGSKFEVYDDLSYMFFNKIAKTNNEIIDTLYELTKEIDKRYENLAKVSAGNIEIFNDMMQDANIPPMPYILLFFNNYYRAVHLDDTDMVNSYLNYILKFGRLVGIYTNVVLLNEDVEEKINYNLQTRISFKAEQKQTSFARIGKPGAEKIDGAGEYVCKMLYSDEVIHLKVPNITQREVGLLIKNIEK